MSLINLVIEWALKARIAYYRWALDSMGLAHADAPAVIVHIYSLIDQLEGLYRPVNTWSKE